MSKESAPATLLDSVQGEVARENSPLLDFIINHIRHIALAFVGFILLLAAYWLYESYTQKEEQGWQKKFGTAAVVNSPQERTKALEDFIAAAPQKYHFTAYLALVQAALETESYSTLYKAWEALGNLQPDFIVEATLGKATALIRQDKKQEAQSLLQQQADALGEAPTDATKMQLYVLYSRLAPLAESTNDLQGALHAYKQLQSLTAGSGVNPVWQQKISSIERALNTK